MYTSHTIIIYTGAVFCALGTYFFFPEHKLNQANINFQIIPMILYAASVSSLLLTIAELFKEFLIKSRNLNLLSKLLERDFEDELSLYYAISECEFGKLGKVRKTFINMFFWLYCSAIPIGVALILTFDLPSNETLTGLTIVTFGLVIVLLGVKEQNFMRENLLKRDLFCKFYKSQGKQKD